MLKAYLTLQLLLFSLSLCRQVCLHAVMIERVFRTCGSNQRISERVLGEVTGTYIGLGRLLRPFFVPVVCPTDVCFVCVRVHSTGRAAGRALPAQQKQLVNKGTVVSLTREMLNYLVVANPEHKAQLCDKITAAAERWVGLGRVGSGFGSGRVSSVQFGAPVTFDGVPQ